jgi:hypothetical protein
MNILTNNILTNVKVPHETMQDFYITEIYVKRK